MTRTRKKNEEINKEKEWRKRINVQTNIFIYIQKEYKIKTLKNIFEEDVNTCRECLKKY